MDLSGMARHRGLMVVTALQAGCAVYFLFDVLSEWPELRGREVHPLIEMLAVLALILGSVLGARQLRVFQSRAREMEQRMRAASGAFLELLDENFLRWGLTPSEREVALFSIKGLSVSEIADLRGTRAGTVKAQSAAVYRKAGVSSRSELLSLFIEDLMSGLSLEPLRAPSPDDQEADPGVGVNN